MSPIKMCAFADRPAGVVATDGSVRGRVCASAYLSDVGGWAISIRTIQKPLSTEYASLHAELHAIAHAAAHHQQHPVQILTDSQTAMRLVRSWIAGNLRYWPGNPNEPKVLQNFMRQVGIREHPLAIDWVSGHSGHALNEGADALARLGSRMTRDGLSKEWVRQQAGEIAEAFTRDAAS